MLKGYRLEEIERVGKNYCAVHKLGFPKKADFQVWYIAQLIRQEYKCYYCETSIFDIKQLIASGKLKSRKIGYGFRGPVLEIDKMVNSEGYKADNCVLACYYCNNDKSYILDSDNYKSFFGSNRKSFFEYLANSII